jgi:hypothetical protein
MHEVFVDFLSLFLMDFVKGILIVFIARYGIGQREETDALWLHRAFGKGHIALRKLCDRNSR